MFIIFATDSTIESSKGGDGVDLGFRVGFHPLLGG